MNAPFAAGKKPSIWAATNASSTEEAGAQVLKEHRNRSEVAFFSFIAISTKIGTLDTFLNNSPSMASVINTLGLKTCSKALATSKSALENQNTTNVGPESPYLA